MKRIFSVRTAVMRGRAMARPYKIPVLFYRSHITYLCIIAEGCEAAPKPSDDGFGLAEGMSAMRFSQGVMSFKYLCQPPGLVPMLDIRPTWRYQQRPHVGYQHLYIMAGLKTLPQNAQIYSVYTIASCSPSFPWKFSVAMRLK